MEWGPPGGNAEALAAFEAVEAALGPGESEGLVHEGVEAAGGRERSNSSRGLPIPFMGGTEGKSVVIFPS
jgi:hypothetical protein